jgi:hypothetical protein
MTDGLTYGEVVALSGDFYQDVESLNQASLIEIFDLIRLIHGPATTGALQAATGGRYLDLASRNVSHFSNVPAGQSNRDTWRRMHSQALVLARQGLVNQAWMANAAADHFLTDSFSGGHIRTPRAALMAQGSLGNIESKIEHDLDNDFGVEVTNDRGDPPWISYGDERLGTPGNAVNRARALEATELSKRDISDALAQGMRYRDPRPYPAERLIPRPTNPAVDRWTGRTPTFVMGPDGPSRQEDDYTQMQRQVVMREAPGVVRGALWSDDDDVRGWVSGNDLAVIGRQSRGEKIRMIDVLLGGTFSWISEDDVQAIERICASVTTAAEMQAIRDHFYSDLPSRMNSIGQRTRVRIALTRL